jgi:hypothetical protein
MGKFFCTLLYVFLQDLEYYKLKGGMKETMIQLQQQQPVL